MLEAKGDNSWEEVPYIKLGQDIIIETSNFTTEQLIVSNYILGENGEILSDKKTWETKSIPVSHGKTTIPLDLNLNENIGSRIKDYNWEGIIEGFVIRADIEGSTFTFAFLLRTGDGGEQVTQVIYKVFSGLQMKRESLLSYRRWNTKMQTCKV